MSTHAIGPSALPRPRATGDGGGTGARAPRPCISWRFPMSQRSGVIVVGVDGSPQGDAALAFALQEAARWGDAVRVVTAWHVDLPPMSYPTLPQAGTLPSRSELKAHAEDIQRRALERAGVPGDVPVSTDVVEGLAGHAL